MTECAQNGCIKTADVVVVYEDPDERVPYCREHGTERQWSDPKAVSINNDPDDLEEDNG